MKNRMRDINQIKSRTVSTLLCVLCAAIYLCASASDAQAMLAGSDSFAAAPFFPANLFDSGSNTTATKEAGEPNHAGNVGGKSVWYKYTTSDAGGYYLSLRSATTNFDTLLAVYTGSSVNALTLVASNDDYGSTPSFSTSTLFFKSTPGTTYYFAIDGFNGASGNYFITLDRNRAHTRSSRFTGTGNRPVSVFRPSNGGWYTTSSNGFQGVTWGQSGDLPVPADYDGDNLTDYAVFRPANGGWYILQSRTNTLKAIAFGISSDKPVPGDYNKDGYADLAVFRPSSGAWYVADTNGTLFKTAQFGQAGDKPIPRDYDSDGIQDFAVFRPSNGTWYILNSRDNSFRAQGWGASEDIPVPGDYATSGTADGLADIAVFRPSSGNWYILSSETNTLFARQWGQAGDIPQPIDIGNPGQASLGVFRPSTGTWYMLNSATENQTTIIQFGQNGDAPVSLPYPVQL